MFAPTTRNGSTMEPKFFTLRKKFYDAVRNFIDKKIKTTWTCCNSNMAMLGEDRDDAFGRWRPKRRLYISKQYHQGRNF
jgi:hypothetical protein